MRKVLSVGLLSILILLTFLGLFYKFLMPGIVKTYLIRNGESMLKTDVNITKVDINLNGIIEIEDLRIKNPTAFSDNNVFKIKNLVVQIKPMTLFDEIIYVEKLNFRNVNILVELNEKRQINILELNKQSQADENAYELKKNDSEIKKKFVIDSFLISNPKLSLKTNKFSFNKKFELPNIQINNIGTKEKGLYPEQIIAGAFTRISQESEKYTSDLTDVLRKNMSEKKSQIINDLGKEEKKIKSLLNEIQNKAKRLGLE